MREGTKNFTEHLFVYGTLLRAWGRPVARRLNMEVIHLGEGAVPGELYNMGYYPALVPSSGRQRWVHGEILRLLCPEKTFAWLDQYEQSGPNEMNAQEYRRMKLPVSTSHRGICQAWAYIFEEPPRARGRHIPLGRFIAVQRPKSVGFQPFSQLANLPSCSAPKKSATHFLRS